MKFDFIYISLHHFLDSRIENGTATADEVIALKKEYRRLYNNAYQKWKRQHKKIIHLAISHKQYSIMQSLADNHKLSLYQFITQSAINPKVFLANELIDHVHIAFTDLCQSIEDQELESGRSQTKEVQEKFELLNQAILKLENSNNDN